MIISHKYRFIFVKTRKTAGTSIEIFLSACCGDGDIVTPIFPHIAPHVARNYKGLWNPLPSIDDPKQFRITLKDLLARNRFYNHIPARTLRKRVSKEIWNDYFKFCVDRNPWDKTLSHYHMMNDRAGGTLTFDDYMERGVYCLNYPSYTDSENRLIVDEVVKYESLMPGLSRIFDRLGIPFDGSLGVKAKSEHRKDRRPYRELLSTEHRRIIEEAHAQEIEMHQYTF